MKKQDSKINSSSSQTWINGTPGPEIARLEPSKTIPFDEGWLPLALLSPDVAAMIAQDNANREAAERQRFITLGEHEAEIERIDQELSAAFGQPVTIRIMIEAERARESFRRLTAALDGLNKQIEEIRAQELWPWLAYGLVLVLALLTAWLIR